MGKVLDTFKVDNITVEITAPSETSTPEEDTKRLGEYVYHIVELGIERERKEYEAYKRGEGVLSNRETTKEYVKFREGHEITK